MAREPCSIVEVLACHPSAVIEMRYEHATACWLWHGECVLLDSEWLLSMARQPGTRLLFVHAHWRDYMTDAIHPEDHDACSHCHGQLRYLPETRQL